jgi:hypothetical protein
VALLMNEMLDALVALQEHDTAIDRLKRTLASLPERSAAHALNERRRAADARLGALAAQLAELSSAEAAVEVELNTVETRAKSLDDNLRSPGSATRDAQAIIHEIDQLRAQAGEFEERALELLEQRDALVAEQRVAGAELEAVAAEAPAVLAAVASAEGDGATELAALEAQRAEAAGKIDAALMGTYERLRANLEGVAVARVVNGTCTGCHLSLSAADLEHLGKLGPGQSATCEQCGRILVPA